MKNKFFILWLAGIISTIIALPYIFALQHEVIEKATIPFPLIILISIIQSSILLAIAVYFGLKLATKINLPIMALSESKVLFKENFKKILKLSVPIGIATALIIKFADPFFVKYIPDLQGISEKIPFWKALTVAPYGGIVEELLMRLFLLTLLAWLLGKISKSKDVVNNSTIMWTAIIATSIVFGIGHLPATATITALTPLVITRAILLNGIGGIFFGWLYWKKGLEYAIVAHFTTDIVLHAILPRLM